MNFFSTSKTLGILGGGQLGKMLLYTTRRWDITTHVMDSNPEAPSKLACNHFTVGNLMDYDAVYNFGKAVDILTIEIENVNTEALKQLKKEGVQVYPQPEVLEKIQNKAIQKQFYATHNIPTAPFDCFASLAALKEAISKGAVSFPFVWKATTMGYDGYGVQVVRTNKDLEQLQEGECIAEDLIPFETEIAVIVAQRPQGESTTYPVVEMEFHPTANQVEYVLCPARIAPQAAAKAEQIALQVAEAFGHVGLLAVEMFLTVEGDILVNEVAPRPHNSGHYSIEAAYTSQFEQHLRCLLDLPLGATASMASAVMVNLVGKSPYKGPVHYKNIDQILALEGVNPHIYGKKDTRPFRKMGHITVVAPEIEMARKKAEEVKEIVEVIAK